MTPVMNAAVITFGLVVTAVNGLIFVRVRYNAKLAEESAEEAELSAEIAATAAEGIAAGTGGGGSRVLLRLVRRPAAGAPPLECACPDCRRDGVVDL